MAPFAPHWCPAMTSVCECERAEDQAVGIVGRAVERGRIVVGQRGQARRGAGVAEGDVSGAGLHGQRLRTRRRAVNRGHRDRAVRRARIERDAVGERQGTEADGVGRIGRKPVSVSAPVSISDDRRVVAPILPSVTLPVPDVSVSDWPPAVVPSTEARLFAPFAALVSSVASSARRNSAQADAVGVVGRTAQRRRAGIGQRSRALWWRPRCRAWHCPCRISASAIARPPWRHPPKPPRSRHWRRWCPA